MPFLKERFTTYEQFAKATLVDVYTPKCLDEASPFYVNTLASGCFINQGDGRFEFAPLPIEAQLAPVFAIAIDDIDRDGIVDVLLGQNFYSTQRETGEMDGGVGLAALGRGDRHFSIAPPRFGGSRLAFGR